MKTILILLSFVVPGLSAFSQTDSLQYYMETATRNNPAVLQKFTEYEASLQKVPQVGGLPDPELSTGIFLSPMELVGGNQLADIRLMQMFPWFGVLKHAKDEMSLMAKAKFELFRDAKLQVCFDLQQTWYELHKTQSAVTISEKNLEILQSLERLALMRFKAGSAGNGSTASPGGAMNPGSSASTSPPASGMQQMGGTFVTGTSAAAIQSAAPMQGPTGGSGLADLYRIQMEAGELENNISILKNQRKTLIVKLNNLMNRPVQMSVTMPDTLKPDILDIPVLAVSDSMMTNNPMLGMLNYEKESLDARKQMVTRMGFPMVGLGINYSLINKNPMSSSPMNGKDMIMPMVTVTLPIYRKKYNAMQTETDLLKKAADQGIQSTTNALLDEYAEAVQNYQDGERRMNLYIRQYKLASQSLNIMTKSFSSSGTGLSDLLRVRQQVLDYGLKQVDAIADFNIAIAGLRRLMASTNQAINK